MPTADRKDRERQQKNFNDELDRVISNPPDHVLMRLNQPSILTENLDADGQHKAGWAKYDIQGNPLKREDPEDLGANSDRKSKREDDALLLQQKYLNIWRKRGSAKIIASNEKLNIRTVQKYIKDFQ